MIEHFWGVFYLDHVYFTHYSSRPASQPACCHSRCHQALWMSSVSGSDGVRKLVWAASIYQCHSGSRGITASVSISACQLVSLTGIFCLWGLHSLTLTLYLPHFPHLCLSLTSACVSVSVCVCVCVSMCIVSTNPQIPLACWWNLDYFSRSLLFVPCEVCL